MVVNHDSEKQIKTGSCIYNPGSPENWIYQITGLKTTSSFRKMQVLSREPCEGMKRYTILQKHQLGEPMWLAMR